MLAQEDLDSSIFEGKYINLISLEGEGFTLPVSAALLSELVRSMVDGT